jgi:hypothetical protein
MAPIDIEEGARAWAAIEILEAAPNREIDVPMIELVRQDPHRVRAVKADQDSPLMSRFCQRCDVESLTAAIQNGGEKNQRDVVAHAIDDALLVECSTVSASHEHELISGIEASQLELALERIEVCREIQLVGEDLGSIPFRSVEGADQSMDVDGCCARGDDVTRACADELRTVLAEPLCHVKPRLLALDPPFDALRLPLLEHSKQARSRPFRLQPERVSREVDLLGMSEEFLSIRPERVVTIESQRIPLRALEGLVVKLQRMALLPTSPLSIRPFVFKLIPKYRRCRCTTEANS